MTSSIDINTIEGTDHQIGDLCWNCFQRLGNIFDTFINQICYRFSYLTIVSNYNSFQLLVKVYFIFIVYK